MGKQTQQDTTALKAAYKHFIHKFVDEIEDEKQLCSIYTFVYAKVFCSSSENGKSRTQYPRQRKKMQLKSKFILP